jgi:hypothetical protein
VTGNLRADASTARFDDRMNVGGLRTRPYVLAAVFFPLAVTFFSAGVGEVVPIDVSAFLPELACLADGWPARVREPGAFRLEPALPFWPAEFPLEREVAVCAEAAFLELPDSLVGDAAEFSGSAGAVSAKSLAAASLAR